MWLRVNHPRLEVKKQADQDKADEELAAIETNEVIESFHRGEITTLPEDAWSFLDNAGIDPDGCYDEIKAQFMWGDYPDEGDFEPDYLEGNVTDKRYSKLMDGETPTKKEVSIYRELYAEQRIYSDNPIGVDVYEVEGKTKSLFVTIQRVEGGEIFNWTAHKNLRDLKHYYATHGQMGDWC